MTTVRRRVDVPPRLSVTRSATLVFCRIVAVAVGPVKPPSPKIPSPSRSHE